LIKNVQPYRKMVKEEIWGHGIIGASLSLAMFVTATP